MALAACYGTLSWRAFRDSVVGTLRVTVMSFLIIFGSATFAQVLAFTGASSGLMNWAIGFDVTPLSMLFIMIGVLLFLGCFMDQLSMMLLTAPIFFPLAKTLGFEDVCHNSLDAVSDRDFAIEFTAAASILMMHISRMSEELVTWMSPRVGFIDIADRFCTGSSIMPQKKNPDVPELARGKTGRVNGHLIALLTLMKGQPLAYNKDNQEDKEPLFDTVDTLIDTLRIFADMAQGITVKPEAMRAAALQGYATATDLADYLVKKGLPFRDAHEAVAKAVKACELRSCDLADLSIAELREFSPLIEDDIVQVLTLEGSVAARNHPGGTAPTQVIDAIKRARDRLK